MENDVLSAQYNSIRRALSVFTRPDYIIEPEGMLEAEPNLRSVAPSPRIIVSP